MIVRERPSFVRLFFILRGSIIQRIFPQLALVMALTAAIVWAHAVKPGLVPAFDGAPFALIGIALSIFLGFRNNACYDRWWEARKHWGHLVSVSRDLARRSLLIEARRPSGQAARARLLRLAIGFAHALVEHVRPSTGTTAQGGTALAYLPEPERAGFGTSRNPPDFILRLIGRELAALRADDTLSDIEFGLFDAGLDQMAGVLAACERLRTTPIPFGYTLLLHRTAYLFCFLLPLGFADVLGWGTPVMTGLVAYTFFGLDALGDELEEPFGTLPNDLPIRAIATTVEINLREALGETDLPALPQPVDHVLL